MMANEQELGSTTNMEKMAEDRARQRKRYKGGENFN